MVCAKEGSLISVFAATAALERQGLGGLRNRKLHASSGKRLQKEVQTWAIRLITFRLYLEVTWHMLSSLTFFLYADYIDREGVKYVEETTVSQSIWDYQKSKRQYVSETILQKQWWRNKIIKRYACSIRYTITRKISSWIITFLFNDSNVNLTQGDLLLQGISLQKYDYMPCLYRSVICSLNWK